MTSRTSYFKSFEDDYYIEKPSGHKLLSEQIKVEKELNEKLTRKMTIRNKLKEYDNLKKLLITLLNVKYPSFCYGWFIHELISKFDISLLNHVPNCNLKIIKNKIIYWIILKCGNLMIKQKMKI